MKSCESVDRPSFWVLLLTNDGLSRKLLPSPESEELSDARFGVVGLFVSVCVFCLGKFGVDAIFLEVAGDFVNPNPTAGAGLGILDANRGAVAGAGLLVKVGLTAELFWSGTFRMSPVGGPETCSGAPWREGSRGRSLDRPVPTERALLVG